MFTDIVGWLWCLLKNMYYFVINNLLTLLDLIAQFALFLLPNTPFKFEQVEWGIFGNVVGYYIPVAKILQHFIVILTAISIYYGIRYLLKMIKQV